MRKAFLLYSLLLCYFLSSGQQVPVTKANYPLAARFSPKKLDKMVFSLSVEPHWLKKSNRFWYTFQTSEGKKWFIVDPQKAEKKLMFDNAKLAAAITTIVKDPFDAEHTGIDSLRFTTEETSIQFEVKSSLDVEIKDSSAKKGAGATKSKKVFYFEYNLDTKLLTELKDFKKPKHKPAWASISPDSAFIVFGRHYNLFWMDKANYAKALVNEDDSSIIEHPLTSNGVENNSYHEGGAIGAVVENNVRRKKIRTNGNPPLFTGVAIQNILPWYVLTSAK